MALESETVGLNASVLNQVELRSGWAWESARLWALHQLDRADLARAGLASTLEQLRRRPRNMNWQSSAAFVGDVIVYLNDTDRAAELLDWLRGFESLHAVGGVGGVYLGPIRRYVGRLQGVLGCWEEAVDSLEQALGDVHALGAIPWISRLQLDVAESYAGRRRLGDRGRAVAVAHEGTRLAEQYGMADLERRGRRLLAKISPSVRRAAD
jgi:hypothetical protein